MPKKISVFIIVFSVLIILLVITCTKQTKIFGPSKVSSGNPNNGPNNPSYTYLINESFDSYTAGTNYPDSSQIGSRWAVGASQGKAVIDSIVKLSGYSLQLICTNAPGHSLIQSLTTPSSPLYQNTSSPIYISCNYYQTNIDETVTIFAGYYTNGSPRPVLQVVTIPFYVDNCFLVFTNIGPYNMVSAKPLIGTYNLSTWNKITIKFDTIAQTYSIWLNDANELDGIYHYPASGKPINYVSFEVDVGPGVTGAVWFDNVQVYK